VGALQGAGGELHALLLLALVAEPDAHDVLLEVELVGDLRDLLAGRARLDREVRLERALLGRRDRRPLALAVDAAAGAGEQVGPHASVARLRLRLLQPRLTTAVYSNPHKRRPTQSLKTEPRIKTGKYLLHSLQSTHVWKWPVVKYKHIKIKPRICVLFILCLTWTVNANSLKQNITVIQEICSS